MGQLLLVQGGAEGAARPVLDRGLFLFHSLLGLEPHEVLADRRVAVAAFPRLNGSRAKIQRKDSRRFRVVVGTAVGDDADNDLRTPLDTLDGLFFAAQGEADAIACATDRGGRLHAYYAEIEEGIVISTSALVLAALLDAALDPLACQELLGTGSVFENRSLFQNVRKLEPATIFELRDGRIASRTRYWDVRSLFSGGAPQEPATVPALGKALVAAVGQTLSPFARPIVDLTGGFDSRAIVAAAIASGRPFHCVVNGNDGDGDVRSAEGIAKAFDLHLLRLRPGLDFGTHSLPSVEHAVTLTDGEFDAVEYADVLEIHSRLARQGEATVNGSAGEVCRGYWWDLLAPHVGSRTHFDHRKAARRFVPDDWADRILASPAAPSLVGHFEDVVRRANAGLEDLPNTVRADNIYLGLRMHRWAGRLASATDRIWPCATPFMFRRPLELALLAPVSARAHNRMARSLIAHLNPKLARLPMAGGYPASPIRLTNALQFLPLVREIGSKVLSRLRGSRPAATVTSAPSAVADLWAQDDVRAILRPSVMKTASLYEPAVLAAFLESSQAAGFTSGKRLGRILTLELVAQALARARGG